MEKVVYDGLTYDRLYRQSKNTLLKVSSLPSEVWESFCNKNLDHVNTPISYDRLTKEKIIEYNILLSGFQSFNSIIMLPYLKGYNTLYNTTFNNDFTTKDILLLLKKNMTILKDIHQDNVTHGDIHSSNIMINEDHDLEFIDFDSGTVDSYVSEDNAFFYEQEYTSEEKIKKTRDEDKLDLLLMYLSYLGFGNFKKEQKFSINIYDMIDDALCFDKVHKQGLYDIINDKNTTNDYYYLDFIDSLISTDYQSPIVYCKNLIHEYSK